MPTRKSERTSATAILVAVLTGAVAAGAGTVAAEPRLSLGRALAAVAGTTPPAPPAGAGTAITPGATTAPAATASGTPAQSPTTTAGVTTTEPTVAPSTTEPPSTTPPTTPSTTRPPATPAPSASSTAPAGTASSQTDRVVELVNAERRRAGCRALTVDQRLLQAAQAHSTDMAVNGYFSHISPDGRTYADRIRAAGYPAPAAENIAYGQRSADEVMRAWMNSRGHRANILNCDHVAIGVGLDTRGWYWTQNFGR